MPDEDTDEADIHFIYNATMADKRYSLSTTMVDASNLPHSGTVTLEPVTSMVLFGAGTVAGL